jgi:asparagine synthase (glutamine-hydrolysing)
MCGIAGIVGKHPDNKMLVQRILDKQTHRGPDAQGIWSEEGICLGHNRLSILDLSEAANQPMISTCGRYVLVFNGEIYNYLELKRGLDYKFRTNSDSEVLLAMYIRYRAKMMDYLNGMFAFAIWDREQHQLFAARDRFGVKPFYYTFHQGQFLFASEIKSLLAAGVDPSANEAVWADYLVHGTYGYPNETFYKQVQQLPAGHHLQIASGNSQPIISKYYDFASRVQEQKMYEDAEKLQTDYLELLLDSIALRFRADVPVGFNVSGGLDSSTLLSLISQVKEGQTENIEAFTFYTGDKRYDELPWVQDLIAKTKSPLNPVLLQSEEVPALIEKVSYYQDEPYGGFPTLAYSKIFEAARAKGILVLLDGQGMDESWAGYDYYQSNSKAIVQGVKTAPTRAEVLNLDFVSMARQIEYPQPFDSSLQNKQYRDIFYTKIPRALRFNDRISMMHSTELREPFLDYRLVEMGFAQKPEMKIKDGQGKWVLRQLVQQSLGDIALAPKRPLQTPQREWIAEELKTWIGDLIQENSGILANWFDTKKVQQLYSDYCKQKPDNSFYIWQVVNAITLLKGARKW